MGPTKSVWNSEKIFTGQDFEVQLYYLIVLVNWQIS